jgi:hypothetical protein
VRQQQRLVDLVEVVIFRSHPEHRHAFHACLFHLPGQCQYRCGFEQRHQRAAEKSNLLAGDYRKSAVT